MSSSDGEDGAIDAHAEQEDGMDMAPSSDASDAEDDPLIEQHPPMQIVENRTHVASHARNLIQTARLERAKHRAPGVPLASSSSSSSSKGLQKYVPPAPSGSDNDDDGDEKTPLPFALVDAHAELVESPLDHHQQHPPPTHHSGEIMMRGEEKDEKADDEDDKNPRASKRARLNDAAPLSPSSSSDLEDALRDAKGVLSEDSSVSPSPTPLLPPSPPLTVAYVHDPSKSVDDNLRVFMSCRREEEAAARNAWMMDARDVEPAAMSDADLVEHLTRSSVMFNRAQVLRAIVLWQRALGERKEEVPMDEDAPMKCMKRLYFDAKTSSDVERRFNKLAAALQELRAAALKHKWLEHEHHGRDLDNRLKRTTSRLSACTVLKYGVLDAMQGLSGNMQHNVLLMCKRQTPAMASSALSKAQELYSEFAGLLDKVLDVCARHKLVRIDGRVYKPVSVPEAGDETRAYEEWQTGEVKSIVWELVQRDTDPDLFGSLFHKGSFWKQIGDILAYVKDSRFPERFLNRYHHQFTTGIYDVEHDKFYRWRTPEMANLAPHIYCCTYTNHPFLNDLYEYHMHVFRLENPVSQHDLAWTRIPTPELSKIPEGQKWKEEETNWWYAGGGRMLYPIGKREKWQRMWLHLGRAGCGKTTTLKAWAGMLPPHKIRVSQNNCEKTFALQDWEGGYAWFGFDIQYNWQMDPTVWNTIVEGGLIPIARKYLGVKLTNLDMHGAIACNHIMKWKDANGNIMRRLFPHAYRYKPERSLGRLDEALERNKGATMKKVNLAYRYQTERPAFRYDGDTAIPEMGTDASGNTVQLKLGEIHMQDYHLPREIRETLSVLQQELNPLMAFMKSGDTIAYRADYYVDIKTFTSHFRAWMEDHQLKSKVPQINDTFFADVLDECKLSIIKTELLPCMISDAPYVPPPAPSSASAEHKSDRTGATPDRNKKINQKWIIGMTFRSIEHLHPVNKALPVPRSIATTTSTTTTTTTTLPEQQQQQQQQRPPLGSGGGNGNENGSRPPTVLVRRTVAAGAEAAQPRIGESRPSIIPSSSLVANVVVPMSV